MTSAIQIFFNDKSTPVLGSLYCAPFSLRFPANAKLDVSSIETSGRVAFYNASGASIGTLTNIPPPTTSPFTHFVGDNAKLGLESYMSGNLVNKGQTVAVRSWLVELSILKDPNGLLTNSQWPYFSYGIKADGLSVPIPEPPILCN
jgi:hypothetical protein